MKKIFPYSIFNIVAYTENSPEVTNAYLSPTLSSPLIIGKSKILGQCFETTIEDIQEQPGSKYLPKSGELVWGLPMLEITTPHGIYITYQETEWVFTQAKKDKCLVWTQSSTRKNWLWIHEGPNEEYDEQICRGCCDYHSRIQKRRRYY